jgi:DNA-binding MarR family transcriptional regulator
MKGSTPIPPRPIGVRARVDATGNRIAAAWRELRRCSRQLRERAQATEREPLDIAQLDALEFLTQRQAWRMGDLASALRIDASSATRVVDTLVAGGLASRSRAVDDARSILAVATPKGRRRYAAQEERRRWLMKELLHGFSHQEREALASLLERLVGGVDLLLSGKVHEERPRGGAGQPTPSHGGNPGTT